MNGQRCTAGSRLLVAAAALRGARPGGRGAGAQHPRRRPVRRGDRARPADPAGAPRARAAGTSSRARGGRARAWRAAKRPADCPTATSSRRRCSPTSRETMRVFREEIFGPVLVATPFDDEAEAIRLANATAVRARGLRLDERPRARASGRAGDRRRPRVDELAERPRPPHALRRDEAERHRPRGRPLQLRVLLRARDHPRRARRAPDPPARDCMGRIDRNSSVLVNKRNASTVMTCMPARTGIGVRGGAGRSRGSRLRSRVSSSRAWSLRSRSLRNLVRTYGQLFDLQHDTGASRRDDE